jgi:hypothetical protein
LPFLGTIINDGNNNSISINYPGNTNQYKLVDLISGITIYDFQSSAVLQRLPGIYTAFVRDTVHAIKPLIVILFTCSYPNEDSINDLWTIKI